MTKTKTMRNLCKGTCLFILMLLHSFAWGQFFEVEKLNRSINTPSHDEISPVISKDGSTIYFTREGYPVFNQTLMEDGKDLSKRYSTEKYKSKLAEIYSSMSGNNIKNPIQSAFNQDIWMAETRKSKFDFVTHPRYPLNNAFPNSLCALLEKEQTAIVINQFPKKGNIKKGFSMSRKLPSGQWSYPEPILIDDIENIEPDVGLTISDNGAVLILSMDRKDGYGGNDLYVSFRKGAKHWGAPIHLGPAVNSAYREITPSLSGDGRTLFYSSNRRGGSGGSDIYMVYRLDDSWQNWTAPMKFVNPINTASDESQPFFVYETGELFFTSKRGGSSDIYKVKIAPPKANEVTVIGNVLNAEEKKLEKSATVFLRSTQSGIYQDTYVTTDGSFEIQVPKGQSYQLLAKKPGYQSQRKTVSFDHSDKYFKKQHVNLALKPLAVGEKIDLNTIYFKQSTAVILPQSFSELQYLSEVLKENDRLIISIEGHTDNQGGIKELKALSEKRAKVIKDFLVKKKRIASNRIKSVGYGPTAPLNNNATESQRKKNRRVEIKIVRLNNKNHDSTTTSSINR